jgi:hypothetical protein
MKKIIARVLYGVSTKLSTNRWWKLENIHLLAFKMLLSLLLESWQTCPSIVLQHLMFSLWNFGSFLLLRVELENLNITELVSTVCFIISFTVWTLSVSFVPNRVDYGSFSKKHKPTLPSRYHFLWHSLEPRKAEVSVDVLFQKPFYSYAN